MIHIIEDCAPYYVRFTHNNIEDVINRSLAAVNDINFTLPFTHYKLDVNDALSVKEVCPLFDSFDLNIYRVSMFISRPRMYYRAHKDGLNHKFSINYNAKISDDKCITSWYSDEDLKHYDIDNLPTKVSRECIGFTKENHLPLKSMIAKQGECVLFNTDIFHDWDNRNSDNHRMVLTLRLSSYYGEGTSFDDARNVILKLAGYNIE